MSMCISGYANTGRTENKFHDSDLFFSWFWGLNSDHQVWLELPLFAEPSL